MPSGKPGLTRFKYKYIQILHMLNGFGDKMILFFANQTLLKDSNLFMCMFKLKKYNL